MRGTSQLLALWRQVNVLTICLCVFFALLTDVSAQNVERGNFTGRLVTEWLDDGRNMKLVDTFGYESGDRTVWKVPGGTVVNGASIPQFLWSFIGSPFGDKYRKASVIHDYYCELRTRDWQRVHRVFYEAMLASGVDQGKAWLMYQAVNRFGPRWELAVRGGANCKRVNGKIDFSRCTLNTLSEKPKLIRPSSDPESIHNFIEEMKQAITLKRQRNWRLQSEEPSDCTATTGKSTGVS